MRVCPLPDAARGLPVSGLDEQLPHQGLAVADIKQKIKEMSGR